MNQILYKGLKEDLKNCLKFQLGVSKFQFEVSFLIFDGSDQSFEVRACMNHFDCNWMEHTLKLEN